MTWRLAIDFGTSNTAAATADDSGVAALGLTHRSNLLPSAVFLSRDSVYVGEAAQNHAHADPLSFCPSPKRLIGQDSVHLDGREVPMPELISPVLKECYDKARAHHGGTAPERVVLTHPEAWSSFALDNLRAAAAAAGIDPATTEVLSEPRAAVRFYSEAENLAPGQRVAVFDFGGGTLDVAVLEMTPTGEANILAARGDNTLGGRTIDAALRTWIDDQLDDLDPDLWDALDGLDHLGRTRLEDSIRQAKEVLSDAPDAAINIEAGGRRRTLLLSREEFNELIRPHLERGIALVRETLRDSGTPDDGSCVCYLTGGSSRIPLVQELLGDIAEVATLDDPKTVVSRGTLTELRPAPAEAVPARTTVAGESEPARPTGGAPRHAAGTVAAGIPFGNPLPWILDSARTRFPARGTAGAVDTRGAGTASASRRHAPIGATMPPQLPRYVLVIASLLYLAFVFGPGHIFYGLIWRWSDSPYPAAQFVMAQMVMGCAFTIGLTKKDPRIVLTASGIIIVLVILYGNDPLRLLQRFCY